MNLIDALSLKQPEVISLVGGGGKTTLMFALARELVLRGFRVISTTTTKVMEPDSKETQLLLIGNVEDKLNLIRQNLERSPHVTLASEKLDYNKLKGLNPDFIEKSDLSQLAPYLIIEADGAKHHSLKAPKDAEPVIPQNTTLVIPVVGIDALGCRLTEESVFRSEIAAKLLDLPLKSIISGESIAALITHPLGIAKGSPSGARIIPFINKMDLEKDITRGEELAVSILKFCHTQIEKIVLGQVQFSEPVLEVVSKSAECVPNFRFSPYP